MLPMTKTIEKLARKPERIQPPLCGVLPHIMALNSPKRMIFEILSRAFSYNIAVVINRSNNGREKKKKKGSNGIVRMKNLARNQCVFRKAIAFSKSFSQKHEGSNSTPSIKQHRGTIEGGRGTRRGTHRDSRVSTASRAIPPKRSRIKLTFNS